MDIVSKIIAYENGELNGAETIYLFSELLKTKMAYSLQGHYGRQARNLIDAGVLMEDGDIDEMRAIELGIEM